MASQLTFNDGTVLENGHEITLWDPRTQDRLCDTLFPGDKVVRNDYLTKKRAKSYTGHHVDIARIADVPAPETGKLELDLEKLTLAGGERLVALYAAGMNFGLAARELEMREPTLRKWFARWREEAVAGGLKPEDILAR